MEKSDRPLNHAENEPCTGNQLEDSAKVEFFGVLILIGLHNEEEFTFKVYLLTLWSLFQYY